MALFVSLAGFGCGTSAPATPDRSVTPTPAASIANPTSSGGKTVKIESADKALLIGTFLAADKPNSPALLLLHQWQSDRHSYDDFAKRMQAKGFNVLSIDGRGFGESTKYADGRPIAAERSSAAVQAMLGDVGAAFEFLSKQNNVDSAKIGIVGASYGSSLALIYAADHQNVAAVALLSPGLNYFGNLPIESGLGKYYNSTRPIFLAAARDDSESDKTVTKIVAEGMPQDYPFTIFRPEKGGHGTDLFSEKVGLQDQLEEFLTRNLDRNE